MSFQSINESKAPLTAVRPTRVKGWGGQGVEALTWLMAIMGMIFRERVGKIPVDLRAIDLDHGSIGIRKRLSLRGPSVTLGSDQIAILPDTPICELRKALLRDPATRAYGERIPASMTVGTRTGAGKERAVGFGAGIAHLPMIDTWITNGAENVRDARRIREAAEAGIQINLDAPDTAIDIVCGAGGVGSGMAAISATLDGLCAQRMGSNSERLLFVGMPLPGYGGDPVHSAVNCLALIHECCLSHAKPGKAVIRSFGGQDFRIEEPLWKRIYIFTGGNRHLRASSRDAVSFQMATAAAQMILGDTGNVIDAEDQDAEVALADVHTRFGSRVMARFGASRIAFDPELMADAIANSGAIRLANYLKRGTDDTA